MKKIEKAIKKMISIQNKWNNYHDTAKPTPTMEEFLSLTEKTIESKKEFVDSILASGQSAPVLKSDFQDGRSMILSPSAQKECSWQLTYFDVNGDPWGDTNFPSQAQALKVFASEANFNRITIPDKVGNFACVLRAKNKKENLSM